MRHEHQGLPCSGKDCVKANPPKVRPGRVTDAMVEAYAETVAGMDGGRASVIREGLVAAFTQRATEIRDASTMTREQRIAERTRDLLDEIVSVELHPINYDPYPASVGEVADEIARYVLELNDSGAAQGLILELMRRLPLAATIAGAEQSQRSRVRECRQGEHRDGDVEATHRIAYVGPRGGDQQWTTDVCARHASVIRDRMIRQGNREVWIKPAGWTPQDDEAPDYHAEGVYCGESAHCTEPFPGALPGTPYARP